MIAFVVETNWSLISKDGWEKPGREKGTGRTLHSGGLGDGVGKTIVEVLRREHSGHLQRSVQRPV